MRNQFDKVNRLIKEYFGGNLISLAIFGSSCRNKDIKVTSDLDYFVILKNRVVDQDKISRDLKKYLSRYYTLLAFNIYDRSTFINLVKKNDWLVLSVKLGYVTIYDKDRFFRKEIEKKYKDIKSKRIAPLGWHIYKKLPDVNLINHLFKLSDSYLRSSRVVADKRMYDVANLLLLDSIHSYLSALMLRRNIFITRGEIVQCFIKNCDLSSKDMFRDELLKVEQVCGQIEQISFNFDRSGKMKYIKNNKYLKRFYEDKSKVFSMLKIAAK